MGERGSYFSILVIVSEQERCESSHFGINATFSGLQAVAGIIFVYKNAGEVKLWKFRFFLLQLQLWGFW